MGQIVYLSRRNLLTLLSKLDRAKAAEQTACTLIKNDTVHPKYPCSDRIVCVAVEDDDYYADRPAGAVNDRDEALVPKPASRVEHPFTGLVLFVPPFDRHNGRQGT